MLSLDDLKVLLHRRELDRKDKMLILLASLDDKPKTVRRIKEIAVQTGLREINRWNVSDILKSTTGKAILVDDGWVLNAEGKKHLHDKNIKELTNLFVENAIQDLRKYFTLINSSNTLSFLNEAIVCLERGLKRASVVLSWVGAVSVLQEHVLINRLNDFNLESKNRFKNWKSAKTKDDLSLMTENHFLEVIEELSIIGKDVKKELLICLQLRNSCGHPNSLDIGETRVAAHIEILILNVFSKF